MVGVVQSDSAAATACWLLYQKHLNEEDWTKEETDHLFELCQQFDLRFPVVCDRYNSWAVKVNADMCTHRRCRAGFASSVLALSVVHAVCVH